MPKQINPFTGKKVLGSNNSKKAQKRPKKSKGKGMHLPYYMKSPIMLSWLQSYQCIMHFLKVN